MSETTIEFKLADGSVAVYAVDAKAWYSSEGDAGALIELMRKQQCDLIRTMYEPTGDMRVAALNTRLPNLGEPPLYEKVWQAMLRTFADSIGIKL